MNMCKRQQGRRQIFRKVHMFESLSVLPGDLNIAGPERLLFLIEEAPDQVLHDFCTVGEDRQFRASK